MFITENFSNYMVYLQHINEKYSNQYNNIWFLLRDKNLFIHKIIEIPAPLT